jgi:hypothetical protein
LDIATAESWLPAAWLALAGMAIAVRDLWRHFHGRRAAA